ncbi:hypothetical protein AO411_2030690 [Salmonella enterica subsp. enterica serovar Sarajane]|nr:hypothetical protein AO411_2030690 [Salmonella enterica subsp. enterica serovar Sarajane]
MSWFFQVNIQVSTKLQKHLDFFSLFLKRFKTINFCLFLTSPNPRNQRGIRKPASSLKKKKKDIKKKE